MFSTALNDLSARGASLFGQGDRLLRLRFSEGSGIAEDALLPHILQGDESLSHTYRYQLDCLSADAYLELKELLGQPAEIGLLLAEGEERLLTGIITQAQALGADGGFACYRLIIEPALATLAYRRNSRVLQDRTVIQIVQTLLDEHQASNPVFAASFQHQSQVGKTYPPRSYCLQYRESDLAFIERLLAEEGISYSFTHGPDPKTSISSSGTGKDTPLHTLILFDSDSTPPQNHQDTLRFHRTDGAESEDGIDQWGGTRQIQSGATQLASFDYKAVSTHTGAEGSRIQQGSSGSDLSATLEDYDPQTLYYGSDTEEVSRYTLLRQQGRDLASKTYTGEGGGRSLLPWTWFNMQDHPVHDQDNPEDREFLITSLHFEARNNLTPEAQYQLGPLLGSASNSAQDSAQQNQPPYRNQFQAVRRHVPIVPEYNNTQHQKPTAPGVTTAMVVGPAEEEIHTDEHGRIKIQFHWQRKTDHPEGGADLDDKSSTWVRVAYPSAGAQWGSQYIPRVGQEVLVSFLEGDIDRPVVSGVLYNGTHLPAEFSGAGKLPANKTLSGVKSKEYKGSGYNELLFDDSTEQLRTRLSSEHGKTQLNQGFLIHPRTDGKGDPRGEGFELRSDQSGALRAAKGLLLSAEVRESAAGNQLDRDMLISQAQVAEETARFLSDLSDQHGAEKSETEAQSKLVRHLENWEKGSNTEKEASAAEGGQPIIALSGPMGIAASTPESMTLTTGNNLDLISIRHTNHAVGGKWLARVTESFSLFVHKLGMKLIAAGGHIDIQAQDGEIRISAQKKIILTSNEEIIYQAPKVTAIAQGAKIDMGGAAITTQCQGTLTQKAGHHNLIGPGGGTPKGAFSPKDAHFDQKVLLHWTGSDTPIQNRKYRLTLEDGRILEGTTDTEGRTQHLLSDLGFTRYTTELLPE